jgi:hypothetical protein
MSSSPEEPGVRTTLFPGAQSRIAEAIKLYSRLIGSRPTRFVQAEFLVVHIGVGAAGDGDRFAGDADG